MKKLSTLMKIIKADYEKSINYYGNALITIYEKH